MGRYFRDNRAERTNYSNHPRHEYEGSYGSRSGSDIGDRRFYEGRSEFDVANSDYDDDMRFGRSGIERQVPDYEDRDYNTSYRGSGAYDEDDYDSNYGSSRSYEDKSFSRRPGRGRFRGHY